MSDSEKTPSDNKLSSDLIHRFLFEDSDIRGEVVTLSTAYQDAMQAQSIPKELQPLYGQFLAGASMIGEILKFDGLITLQARGEGAVNIMMAEANQKGDIRGIVSAQQDGQFVNDDTRQLKPLSELIGNGVLALTLDPTQGQRYQGIVPLDGENLANCLEHYFEQSEQIPTYIVLFANEQQCGGIFLQCLPPSASSNEEERKEKWNMAMQLAATMKTDEFFSTDHETLLFRLFHELQCRIFEPKSVQFKCSCSKARSLKALQALPKDDIASMIEEGEAVEIDCHFCGAQYQFEQTDLRALLNPHTTLH